MGRFFSGRNKDSGEPEDFVLMQQEASEVGESASESAEGQSVSGTEQSSQIEQSSQYEDFDSYEEGDDPEYDNEDEEDELSDTTHLNVSKISEALNKSSDAKKKRNSSEAGIAEFIKKHRIPTICVCSVLILGIISLAAFGIIKSANPLRNYAQVAVAKENIVSTMEESGVLSPGDKYEIMSLVAGKIAECNYEVGDSVKEGDVLYQLDDTEAKLALERAKNELDRAKDPNSAGAVSGTARITATDTGTIQTINIKQGASVTAGSQVGTIKKSDGAVVPIISYVSGSVMMVNVAVGRQVSMGQILASVKPTSASATAGSTEYDKKTGEIDVQSAQKQLDNYTIKSPVSGVITEKNSKTGDNVGAGSSYKPMMVVMDTSKLTLTVSVSEDRISEVKKGQSVTLTSDSVPDTTFSGEVSNVSLEGRPVDGGKTAFDVTITISEPGKLKAGMSVKAKIVLDSVKNTMAVDKKALLKTDGQNALVLVKLDNSGEDRDVSETTENQNNNPEIKVPKGCELRTVRYGISDENKVQILSGLKLGEIVVYDPEADNGEFIPSTNSDSDDDELSDGDMSGRASSDNENIGDEEAKNKVKERMQNMLDSGSI